MVRRGLALGLVLAVYLVSGCGEAVAVAVELDAGRPVVPPELESFSHYEYELGPDGMSIELEDCSVAVGGDISASIEFNNPGPESPTVAIFAIDRIGVEHIEWNVPHGTSVAQITNASFSSEAKSTRLVDALTSANFDTSQCFVAILGWLDDVQRSVSDPNSVVELAPSE